MSQATRVLALSAVALLAAGALEHARADCDSACREELSATREATQQYHKEITALDDGYLPTDACVASPAGGMGYHYIKPALVDLAVDAQEPELLLYEPAANGKRRLVAVEYFVPVINCSGSVCAPWFGPDPPTGSINPAPTLFGQTFNGPMPGHEPGMPWHYDLHVWIWKNNPSGMFAQFNPAVSCSND